MRSSGTHPQNLQRALITAFGKPKVRLILIDRQFQRRMVLLTTFSSCRTSVCTRCTRIAKRFGRRPLPDVAAKRTSSDDPGWQTAALSRTMTHWRSILGARQRLHNAQAVLHDIGQKVRPGSWHRGCHHESVVWVDQRKGNRDNTRDRRS